MTGLRLLADDLTGAVDSGCAFASPDTPVYIAVPGRPLPAGDRLAMSTESRDMPVSDAVARVFKAMADLACEDPAILWFKKIDSVLRGHPFAETKAVLEAGNFSHCIFAPAYPDMGRITVGTQQFVTGRSGPPQPVGADFRHAFGSLEQPPARGTMTMTFVEADSQHLLQQRALAAASSAKGRMLWVGTGGLAAALAPARGAMPPLPPIRGMIVGTSHPSTREQVSAALAADMLRPISALAYRGEADRKAWLLSPGLTAANAEETSDVLRREMPTIVFGDPASTSLLVTGGDTLSIVLEVTGADSLECIGDAAPGVPVSRIHGGRWHGLTLLSKSGGFGDPALMVRLISGL